MTENLALVWTCKKCFAGTRA